jgi:hypothetical protein
MGKTYEQLNDKLTDWITQQHMFFVATAPLSAQGLVNVSPKGLDSFAILDPHTVAYLDLTGSGVETIAHLKENGRITIMFCAFNGSPNILRLYGQGEVLEPSHPEFSELRGRFPDYPGVRSVIRISVSRISDSCGFGVPLYEYQGDRNTLLRSAEKKGETAMAAYRAKNNDFSLDGLPGLAS